MTENEQEPAVAGESCTMCGGSGQVRQGTACPLCKGTGRIAIGSDQEPD